MWLRFSKSSGQPNSEGGCKLPSAPPSQAVILIQQLSQIHTVDTSKARQRTDSLAC